MKLGVAMQQAYIIMQQNDLELDSNIWHVAMHPNNTIA